jgi:hypothetical protein
MPLSKVGLIRTDGESNAPKGKDPYIPLYSVLFYYGKETNFTNTSSGTLNYEYYRQYSEIYYPVAQFYRLDNTLSKISCHPVISCISTDNYWKSNTGLCLEATTSLPNTAVTAYSTNSHNPKTLGRTVIYKALGYNTGDKQSTVYYYIDQSNSYIHSHFVNNIATAVRSVPYGIQQISDSGVVSIGGSIGGIRSIAVDPILRDPRLTTKYTGYNDTKLTFLPRDVIVFGNLVTTTTSFNANSAVTGNTLTTANNTIKLSTADSLRANDQVQYIVSAGNTAITGLSNSSFYYVNFANSTTIALSTTLGGKRIALTKGKTESGHSFNFISGYTRNDTTHNLIQSASGKVLPIIAKDGNPGVVGELASKINFTIPTNTVLPHNHNISPATRTYKSDKTGQTAYAVKEAGAHSHQVTYNANVALRSKILKAWVTTQDQTPIANGIIIAYSIGKGTSYEGLSANSKGLPIGWCFCDGNNDTPDLRGYYIYANFDTSNTYHNVVFNTSNSMVITSISMAANGNHSHLGPLTGQETGVGAAVDIGSHTTEDVLDHVHTQLTSNTVLLNPSDAANTLNILAGQSYSYTPPTVQLAFIMYNNTIS